MLYYKGSSAITACHYELENSQFRQKSINIINPKYCGKRTTYKIKHVPKIKYLLVQKW
jgi:hypothetical protein